MAPLQEPDIHGQAAGSDDRLAAVILAAQLGREPFSSGRVDLENVGDARDADKAALKVTDAGELGPYRRSRGRRPHDRAGHSAEDHSMSLLLQNDRSWSHLR